MVAELKNFPRRHHTIEEYFALERVGDARYEYWDGDILCMSGGSRQHARICSNLHFRLSQQIGAGRCQAFTGDLAVKTPLLPPYRYPDVTVACGEPLFEKLEGSDALINPVVVIEVLSPATASLDRNQKRAAYQALPSVQEILLVAQDAPQLTVYRRQGDSWQRDDLGGLSATVDLPSLGTRLALRDIYDGVPFE